MKTILKAILFITIILLPVGCISLEEEILDTPMADLYIKSEADATAVLRGAYSFLTETDLYKDNLCVLLFYSGDDAVTLNSNFKQILERTAPLNNVHIGDPWGEFYDMINNVNSLIAILKTNDAISEEYRNRVLGELYFLRGFGYFNLVRLYGGVPIRTEPTTGTSDFYLKRNTVGEVYELIFEDFKKASEQCIPYSKQPAVEFGRATKGAAQSVLSLAYLTYGNYKDLQSEDGSDYYYQMAFNYADSVILSNEYKLLDNYADLWNVANEKNAYNEVIFGIQFTRDATSSGNPSRGSKFAFISQPAQRFYISGNAANGKGSDQFRLQPWFYDICTTGDYVKDYRSEVSFVTRYKYQATSNDRIVYPETKRIGETIGGTDLYPYLDKYKDPNGFDWYNNENDLFVIRLSEVYLIKAEAENELHGPTDIAYNAFNKLRERARKANGVARNTPADLSPGLSKEEFRLRIFDERGLEFVGECHRWFDAVRMRYLDGRSMIQYRYETFYPNMPTPLAAPSFNSTTNTWGGGRVSPTNLVAWTKRLLLWPIPGGEIDTNPNMTQNTEYGW